jgi:hypothetical protein
MEKNHTKNKELEEKEEEEINSILDFEENEENIYNNEENKDYIKNDDRNEDYLYINEESEEDGLGEEENANKTVNNESDEEEESINPIHIFENEKKTKKRKKKKKKANFSVFLKQYLQELESIHNVNYIKIYFNILLYKNTTQYRLKKKFKKILKDYIGKRKYFQKEKHILAGKEKFFFNVFETFVKNKENIKKDKKKYKKQKKISLNKLLSNVRRTTQPMVKEHIMNTLQKKIGKTFKINFSFEFISCSIIKGKLKSSKALRQKQDITIYDIWGKYLKEGYFRRKFIRYYHLIEKKRNANNFITNNFLPIQNKLKEIIKKYSKCETKTDKKMNNFFVKKSKRSKYISEYNKKIKKEEKEVDNTKKRKYPFKEKEEKKKQKIN